MTSRLFAASAAGAAGGAAAAVAMVQFFREDPWVESRKRMPERIILVRHGESEGNCDHTLYRKKADNLIELTAKGSQQAVAAGKRIKRVIGDDKVHLFVSPFARTLQTARNIRTALPDQVITTYITTQIREQEFGNLQGDDFQNFRNEQRKVGRLYYRFPTGESGCDVYDRVRAWWQSTIEVNHHHVGRPHADSIIVVTHGLTMRLILMQLYGWSPDTFHSVWNADNCDMYVLRKDLSAPGLSPYKLDKEEGDVPKSSREVHATLSDGETKALGINDYLSIPPGRTKQHEMVKRMLEEQHGLEAGAVTAIDFWAGKYSKYR